MKFNAQTVSEIYSSKLASRYDFSMPFFFTRWKRRAFAQSSLKPGDRVLVFCCGTGLDFEPILDIIGEKGKIIGVDFSTLMLNQAEQKAARNNWQNVELIEGDITNLNKPLGEKADVGVCTLGMSIIPDFRAAYANLSANVKENGQIIIGDMQLASGGKAVFNPLTLLMSKRYGGTPEGHQNSLALRDMMERDLVDIKTETFFFGAYFYCIGTRHTTLSRVNFQQSHPD